MIKTRYIFVSGGVLSSLGKGVAAASLANILEAYGYSISLLKLDPYLNVDPGTMSPFQHGEVFVTEDGSETDLDLGHYERFTQAVMTQENNWTAGRIYERVIRKERDGNYFGKTVQVIPHVTDEIKSTILAFSGKVDMLIVEIGGTVGDIESLPFLEAIRQLGLELEDKQTLFIHLTLVPFIKTAGELKTKPTQHSVKELREIGIQPDILLCRTDHPLPLDIKKKIALFTNLKEEDIISACDVENIYEIPILLKEEGLGRIVIKNLGLVPEREVNFKWDDWILKTKNLKSECTIAIVGKYIRLSDSYKSLFEALFHAGVANGVKITFKLIDSDSLLEWNLDECFQSVDGLLIPGGFGIRGIEGMIKAAEFARIRKIPFFGICLGMQVAVIEFIRHVVGKLDAHSTEFNAETSNKVFLKLKELTYIETMGHTMRLGSFLCMLKKGSIAYASFGAEQVFERHRHRYEFNPDFEKILEQNGMMVSGKNPERNLVEIVEISDHPWFLGCQFHPEFKSRPLNPHPLFVTFVKKSFERKISSK